MPAKSRTATPDYALADELLEALKAAHWDNSETRKGMHAYGYTPAEQEAIDLVVKEAVEKQGMEAFSDLLGNMYLIKRGRDHSKTNVIVSHLDTVEKGGAHDGRDGIAAGMAVVSGLNQAGITPDNDLCVMIARSEESCVNRQVSIGARAATGQMSYQSLSQLKNRISGKSVLEHMKELGLPVALLKERLDASPTLFPTGTDAQSLIGFLAEAHIEQGKYNERNGSDVGIVTAIRGNTRALNIEFRGEAAHSGATYEQDRADTNIAMARLAVAADDWKDRMLKQGHDINFTFPIVECPNHSGTTIPPYTKAGFEVRSAEPAMLEAFEAFIRSEAKRLAEANPSKKLAIDIGQIAITAPAEMSAPLVEHTQKLAKRLGIRAARIISGAGHDTAAFANTGTPSVMLFIKQDDAISHNPAEAHNKSSFRQTCDLLSAMVLNPPPERAPAQEGKSFLDYLKAQGATAYKPGQLR